MKKKNSQMDITEENNDNQECNLLRRSAHELLDLTHSQYDVDWKKVRVIAEKMLARANTIGPKSRMKEDKEAWKNTRKT